MKILVFGDIHGRTDWKLPYIEEDADLTIFLGDYVSTHDNISSRDQIKNLKEILKEKKNNPNGIVMLRGNHDMQHLGYYWAQCSGFDRKVYEEMIKLKDEFLANTQWIYLRDNILFSHAGISKDWMKYYDIKSINDINGMEPSEAFGFTPCKLSDYTGISATQPCTWIRPQTLMDCAIGGYVQVVGHTPVRGISNLKDIEHEVKEHIWLCDNMPDQYLLIEDGKFTVKNIK